VSRAQAALKRIFVGRPMTSGEHTLLPKVIALPVFEPGVVVVSIPYHLTPTDRTTEPAGVSGD
jgi:hypothetical protein